MFDKINNFARSKQAKELADVRNIILYIFALIVLAITWSGVKAIQANYDLQKHISVIKQENAVLELENKNAALQNKFLGTDQYLELSARQNLGLAAPGEKVLTIPKDVAMKYIQPSTSDTASGGGVIKADNRSKYQKNLQDWRDFLLGRKLFSD